MAMRTRMTHVKAPWPCWKNARRSSNASVRTVTEITASPTAPFNVEVLVYEEDTYLVLSAGSFVRETPDPAEVLMQVAAEQKAVPPGQIVERGQRWYAVIHDFDDEESLQDRHIDTALENLLALITEQEIASVGIQALGAYHGSKAVSTFTERLNERRLPACLERIWVITR